MAACGTRSIFQNGTLGAVPAKSMIYAIASHQKLGGVLLDLETVPRHHSDGAHAEEYMVARATLFLKAFRYLMVYGVNPYGGGRWAFSRALEAEPVEVSAGESRFFLFETPKNTVRVVDHPQVSGSTHQPVLTLRDLAPTDVPVSRQYTICLRRTRARDSTQHTYFCTREGLSA